MKNKAKQLTNHYYHSKNKIFDILVNYIPINFFALDKQGIYAGCNQAMLKSLGMQSDSELLGRNAKEFDEASWENCMEVINTGEASLAEEAYQDKTFLSVKAPWKNDKDETIGVFGIAIDITKQKQAELAKTAFISDIEHDLITPFSGILSVTEYLLLTEKDPEKKEDLNMVVTSAQRFVTLIRDILQVAEVSHPVVEKHPVNIFSEVQQAIDLMRPTIQTKKLHLSVSCPKASITIDQRKFNRILINLLTNAVKFTHNGTIDITLILDKSLKLIIADTGIGIPSEQRDKIFNRFTKAKRSNTHHTYEGLGNGLFIVKRYVDDLNGTIHVTSELGKGSQFQVNLPLS